MDVTTHHVKDYIVGVAIGHESRERTSAGHSETTAVIDNDEITATSLDEFGRQANACTSTDNGLPL